MKKCKQGYYYCYDEKKCKKIPNGYRVGLGGWLRKEKEEEKIENETETKNGNGSNGNGEAVSEGWSEKYKKSIDCKNPKGFSQRAHCQGRKKVNEQNNDILHQGNPNPQMRNMPMGQRNVDKLANSYARSVKSGLIDGANQMSQVKKPKLMKSDSVRVAEAKEKGDHEVSMAQSQLKKSEENIRKLRKALGTKEKNIPAWVQAKITDTEHNTDAASSYMDEAKRDGKSAKDPGYSLRDWFKGGGWVQAGGKYDGKPCAKQPGQTTKPFCRDADDRASMSKDERERRAKKKRREDPNPERKGKAKIVTSEQVKTGPGTPYKNPDDALKKILGPGEKVVPSKPVRLAHYEPEGEMLEENPLLTTIDKALPGQPFTYQGFKDKYSKPYKYNNPMTGANYDKSKTTATQRREYAAGGGNAAMSQKGQTANQVRSQGKINLAARPANPNVHNWKDGNTKVYAGSPPMRFNVKNSYEPEGEMIGEEGKKDACYKKVKSRYDVWPSAYASGALVKCRKVGAANWGNKTKKEDYDYSNWRDEFKALEIESIDIIKTEPLQATDGIGSRMLEEAKKCWKGYKKEGTQKLFGKTYNRCVKEGNKSFGQFMSEAIDKSKMKCNKPKAQAVGDSLTGKSHVVKACEGGKEKIIRFGQRGVKGSPKKKGESKAYASRRHRFQSRHAKNIAKGKMSAAYWANRVKW